MRRPNLSRLACVAASAFCATTPTFAQAPPARAIVVATCGSVSGLPLGEPRDLYMTPDGRLCVAGSAPGGQPTAATADAVGPTPATTTGPALVAKSGAGNLYGYSVTNGATATFLAILSAAAAPAAGAAIAPVECVPVPVNGYVARRQDIPDRYPAGIVMLSTSSCTTYTAVTPALITAVVQ